MPISCTAKSLLINPTHDISHFCLDKTSNISTIDCKDLLLNNPKPKEVESKYKSRGPRIIGRESLFPPHYLQHIN